MFQNSANNLVNDDILRWFQICEQPTGAQADVFIASLSEKSKEELRKFIKTAPPAEERMYFVWIRDIASDKVRETD